MSSNESLPISWNCIIILMILYNSDRLLYVLQKFVALSELIFVSGCNKSFQCSYIMHTNSIIGFPLFLVFIIQNTIKVLLWKM